LKNTNKTPVLYAVADTHKRAARLAAQCAQLNEETLPTRFHKTRLQETITACTALLETIEDAYPTPGLQRRLPQ
jgi:hypothetical protein